MPPNGLLDRLRSVKFMDALKNISQQRKRAFQKGAKMEPASKMEASLIQAYLLQMEWCTSVELAQTRRNVVEETGKCSRQRLEVESSRIGRPGTLNAPLPCTLTTANARNLGRRPVRSPFGQGQIKRAAPNPERVFHMGMQIFRRKLDDEIAFEASP